MELGNSVNKKVYKALDSVYLKMAHYQDAYVCHAACATCREKVFSAGIGSTYVNFYFNMFAISSFASTFLHLPRLK